MESAVCKMCGNKGEIFRPTKKVRHTVWRRDEVGDSIPWEVTTTLGSVDACPVCAVIAEAAWNIEA